MGSLVRTTFGPLGADKMIVRRMQDDTVRTFISNDGVAILEEFEGETDHPIANQLIRLVESHENELGDGTTTTTLLASELLTAGTRLIERGVPPTDVIEGFSIGAQRTLEVWDEIGIPVASTDRPTSPTEFDRGQLEQIAHGGTTNNRTGAWPLEQLSEDIVDAVLRVWEPRRGTVHLGYVAIEVFPGRNVTSSELINGTLLPYEPMCAERLLPIDAGILLVEGSLQPRDVSTNSLSVSGEYVTGGGNNRRDSRKIAEAIAEANVGAVFVTGDVSSEIGEQLARRNAVCFRNVKRSDVDVLSRVTGAAIRGPVTPGEPASSNDLGYGTVNVRAAQDEKTWLEVTAPKGTEPRSVGFVVRGGTESAADEARRRIKDGLNAVRAAVKQPTALPGGGAADVEAALAVRKLAPRFDGREQLAVEEFADVLESLPRTLARNAGHRPLDSIPELRTRHAGNNQRAGIDASGRIVDDVVSASDALDAQLVRSSSLVRSVEFANSLLTVDNVVLDTTPPINPEEIRTGTR